MREEIIQINSMNQDDIQQEILQTLYTEWARGRDRVGLRYLANERQWGEREFNKAIEHLKHKYLIKIVATDLHSQITAHGILETENTGIAPAELRGQSRVMRTQIMDRLGRAWDEKGPNHHVDVDDLLETSGADIESVDVDTCLRFLKDAEYIEDVTIRTFRITPAGYEYVQGWRKTVSIAEEFESLSKLTPQERGRKFQKLLARTLAEHGWRQEEGVNTSHEEMDVIVHREREYYLIECKWKRAPIKASVIRELFGKIENRVDVRGIAASLSGFTTGAVEQSQEYACKRAILLFGKQDVENLIYQKVSFEDLLSFKYNKLVTRREAVYE